jgi:hypothetical protein
VNAWGWIAVASSAVVAGVTIVLSSRESDPTMKHVVGPTGWVEADPQALASAAGVSANVYSLASLGQSEGGGSSPLRIAVMWAARNQAERVGVSIFKLVTRAGRKNRDTKEFEHHPSSGYFGPQNAGPRYASTRTAPSPAAIDEAAQVLAGDIEDPTTGATQWDAPKVQDKLLAAGVEGYKLSADELAKRRSQSSIEVWIPGITSTRFWRPRT